MNRFEIIQSLRDKEVRIRKDVKEFHLALGERRREDYWWQIREDAGSWGSGEVSGGIYVDREYNDELWVELRNPRGTEYFHINSLILPVCKLNQ